MEETKIILNGILSVLNMMNDRLSKIEGRLVSVERKLGNQGDSSEVITTDRVVSLRESSGH